MTARSQEIQGSTCQATHACAPATCHPSAGRARSPAPSGSRGTHAVVDSCRHRRPRFSPIDFFSSPLARPPARQVSNGTAETAARPSPRPRLSPARRNGDEDWTVAGVTSEETLPGEALLLVHTRVANTRQRFKAGGEWRRPVASN